MIQQQDKVADPITSINKEGMCMEAVDCGSKLPVQQRTMQDTFSSHWTSHTQSFPGVGKADTLGMLSTDSWFSQPASDFCQKTTVYTGCQNY